MIIKKRKTIPINDVMKRIEMLKKLRERGVVTWFDRITFLRIFMIWTGAVVLFGIIYFIFSTDYSYLHNSKTDSVVNNMWDTIYFSFVTATTTGFGDVTPFGFFKLLAIIEVVSGLMLLAFVTSKLVSIKQDAILNEVYEISFNEKIYRLRSSLLLFRQNTDRLITKIEEGSIRKREVDDLYTHFSAFEDMLNEVLVLMEKPEESQFTKVVDSLNAELIFTSLTHSFDKIAELINILNQHKLEWKREVTLKLLDSCVYINRLLFKDLKSSRKISERRKSDLVSENERVLTLLKKGLEQSPA